LNKPSSDPVIEVRTDPGQVTNRATIAQLREQARKAAEAGPAAPAKPVPAQAARATPAPRRTGPRSR
jgi:acetolactate synthase-1/2/3 large subunit